MFKIKIALTGFLLAAICNIGKTQNIGDLYPSARSILNEGITLHDKKDYKAAIERYSTINKNDSFYSDIQYELSLSYLANKEYEKARDAALTGLSVESSIKRDLWIAYANALEEMEKFDSAIIVYNKVIKEYPTYYMPYYEKGLSYQKRNKWNNAISAYTDALKQNIYHQTSHLRIGLIAADAQQPAISLMALQMYCIINNEASNVTDILAFMEKVANNQYTPDKEVISNLFAKDELLEELNLVILSKGALSKKYKSKVNLDYHINKQLQVLMEKLPEHPESNDWLINFYVNFYKESWNSNHFEGSILHSFKTINSAKVQKEIKANQKKINEFVNWGTRYLNKVRNQKVLIIDGKETDVTHWYSKGVVTAIGNQDENEKSYGPWTFYNVNGYKTAEGNYENGLKTGKWTYYYFNGQVKSIENYTDGKVNGEYLSYYLNGVLYEKSTYINDVSEGEVLIYNSNNTLRSKFQMKNNKVNGVRYNYDANGFLSYAGELKEGIYEGWYKTYFRNGQVNLDCQTVKDELHGKATYYYENNGKLRTTGAFNNGQRTGKWKWLYEDGTTDTEGEYNNGNETGIWKYYYENGVLKTEENYENGVKKGTVKNYDPEGKLYGEIFIKNGNTDAYKYYDKAGNVIAEAKTSGGKLNYAHYSVYRNKITEGQIVSGKDVGLWKYYYENGQLESESNFEKGKRQGVSKGYYKNGKLKSESYFENGNRKGFYKSYFINGKTETTGYYDEEGNRTGAWNYYNMNGAIEIREFYIGGKLVGTTESHYSDGMLYNYHEYNQGNFTNTHELDTTGKIYNSTQLKHGTGDYTLYTMAMKPDYAGKYISGLREGKFTAWNGNGKVTKEEYFRFGKRNGLSKSFYENGKVSSLGVYKNGDKDSIWTYYDENGKTKRTQTYKNGELHGVYKSFYANGKPETERYYTDGLRNGDYKYFAPDGTLILWSKYEGGVLKSYSYLDKSGTLLPFIELKNETGEIKTYYPNGILAISFKLDRGLLQGTYEVYFPDGKLFSLNTYVDNKDEGESKEAHLNGNLRVIEQNAFNELHGICKYYHENGKLALELPYMRGYKHGISKQYDSNGKLIKQARYIYGKVYE